MKMTAWPRYAARGVDNIFRPPSQENYYRGPIPPNTAAMNFYRSNRLLQMRDRRTDTIWLSP
ncbi:hypothetical protein TH25_10570 [Thalassospira profundimaris]|uniref:Uncharacterized protein n=1 Tax=Thalassospira profundimaris TaxID=502049 RepID=A0A367XC58_9PROT|nr:hypothetical protein TH25_10570 [Thalassospira profundimaris]